MNGGCGEQAGRGGLRHGAVLRAENGGFAIIHEVLALNKA
jgi:hypothetical protein